MHTGNTQRVRLVTAIAALLVVLVTGCSGPKRVPAGGRVELDGQPLDGGILYFNPDASKGNNARVSCTSPVHGGRFDLQTSGIERADTGSGVPPGWYKVSVRVNMPGQVPIFPGQPAYNIDPAYLDPDKTPLEIEVLHTPPPGGYELKLSAKR